MMRDLIAKLEAAKEGSRELDAKIAAAVGRVPDGYKLDDDGEWRDTKEMRVWIPPRFTTSLDAALGLVPEGWNWTDIVWGAVSVTAYLTFPGDYAPRKFEHGNGEDAPLAACSAAMKARVE